MTGTKGAGKTPARTCAQHTDCMAFVKPSNNSVQCAESLRAIMLGDDRVGRLADDFGQMIEFGGEKADSRRRRA